MALLSLIVHVLALGAAGATTPSLRGFAKPPEGSNISASRPLAAPRACHSDLARWSNIQIAGGVSSNRTYLSTTPDGSNVALHDVDEKSGRERWIFSRGSYDGSDYWYNIIVFDGVSNNRAYLSSTPDGSNVHLHDVDEGDGRQRWTVSKGSGDWWHIKVLGGVSSSHAFLSSTPDGSNVHLHDRDDGSGRQRWEFNTWATIRIAGRVSSNRAYLSATPDGANVDLHYVDQGSGRQRWSLAAGGGFGSATWYNIVVLESVSGVHKYLSSTPDGSNVQLDEVDEGSGRQRWTLTKGSGDWFTIKVLGGVSGNRSYLSSTPDGSNVDLHDMDEGTGRQRWKIDFRLWHVHRVRAGLCMR